MSKTSLKSWDDVLACSCDSCLALSRIRDRCLATNEPLFICDCRMFGEGKLWVVQDFNLIFNGKPADDSNKYLTKKAAVAAVLAAQNHCDVFLSSWPYKNPETKDYLWRRERVK